MKRFVNVWILGFWAVMGAFFSACVDINLKSELPKVDYYTLDNIAIEAKNCGAHDIVALESIEIPQHLAGRNLTYKKGNRVHKIERINLNDSLKANIESMLIKSLANHCIRAITPPFSGMKIERYLRIKMLDFGAEKGVESTRDLVESNGDSSDDLVESAQNLGRNSTKNAQNLARVSFAFVLHQNGVILQSGIITKTSPIENFSDEGIFNALQNTTNKAIKTLTNKMIPK